LIRDIENIAAKNSNLCKYATDWRFQWALVLAPKRILSSADTAEMRDAKERLIAHRRVMKHNQPYAVLAILAVFIGVISLDILKALIARNYKPRVTSVRAQKAAPMTLCKTLAFLRL
jgi:hypothetical protein